MSTISTPLAVVAHDAGAANLLFHFLRTLPEAKIHDLRICATGPARNIAARLFPENKFFSLFEAIEGAGTLLSGTGWGSDIEHQARKIASARKLFSVAVIDHWVNYSERFAVNGTSALPDEIWVFDEYAHTKAQSCFPEMRITRQANAYMAEQTRQIRKHGCPPISSKDVNVLYLLEPVRQTWNDANLPGEFQALDFFMAKMPMLMRDRRPRIRLRQHPSEAPGKYDSWLARQPGSEIGLDPCGSLAESIAWADWVVGIETYALTVAVAAGRRVASSLPPWAPALRLPQPQIVQLRNI